MRKATVWCLFVRPSVSGRMLKVAYHGQKSTRPAYVLVFLTEGRYTSADETITSAGCQSPVYSELASLRTL